MLIVKLCYLRSKCFSFYNFDYIRYCEVRDPEEKIEVLPRGFIDIVPNVLENGKLIDKIIVNMHDYKNRTI